MNGRSVNEYVSTSTVSYECVSTSRYEYGSRRNNSKKVSEVRLYERYDKVVLSTRSVRRVRNEHSEFK